MTNQPADDPAQVVIQYSGLNNSVAALELKAKAWPDGGHVVAALQRGYRFAETALEDKFRRARV